MSTSLTIHAVSPRPSPVKTLELKIAFSIAALAFEGDLPASIFHLQLIAKNVDDWNAVAGNDLPVRTCPDKTNANSE